MSTSSLQSGFTLVELIAVILIVGILSAAVLPRFLQPDSFQSQTVQDTLISAAREAQQLAMSQAVSANVQLITDNSNHRIRIQYNANGTQTIDFDIPSATSISNQTVGYDKRGDLTGGNAVSISIDNGSHTVRIEPSGYAHAL